MVPRLPLMTRHDAQGRRRHTRLIVVLQTAGTVLLASCSPSGTPSPSTATSESPFTPPSSSPSKAPSATRPTAAGRRIDITVTGKQVSPDPATVNIAAGESLTIAVTSDRDNTLHAHGFEIEKNIQAGQRAEITVKGTQPGVFEFELHDPELRLFQVAVR